MYFVAFRLGDFDDEQDSKTQKVSDQLNEEDFHLGRIAKARSRAFRAVLTAFWNFCSAAFSWVELLEVV
jgi:hypothetical protein